MTVGAPPINAIALANTVVATQNFGSIGTYCAANATTCTITPAAAPVAPAGAVSNAAVGAETFKAQSSTDCGAVTKDTWTIDQGKTILQVTDCTTGT